MQAAATGARTARDLLTNGRSRPAAQSSSKPPIASHQHETGGHPVPDPDRNHQRKVVDAFLAASREGDFDALVAVLDPEVVLRVDVAGGVSALVRGAGDVARRALDFSKLAPHLRRVLVNGAIGVVAAPGGKVFSLTGFTVSRGKIVAMDILADPERLRRIDPTILGV